VQESGRDAGKSSAAHISIEAANYEGFSAFVDGREGFRYDEMRKGG